MNKYCLTLDLKSDPILIKEYLQHHQNIWPEVAHSITHAGIVHMEIYHIDIRLFMIIHVDDSFSFERKAKLDKGNPIIQQWETLMDNYQARLPFARPEEKWVLMKKIFEL